MPDLATAIPLVRRSTVAILRIQLERPQSVKKGKVRPAKFRVSFGSAFCIVENRYLLTACHVLGAGSSPATRATSFTHSSCRTTATRPIIFQLSHSLSKGPNLIWR